MTITEDEKRAYAVKEIAIYIREYLEIGGTLIAAYSQKGRELRSQQELSIYETELKKYNRLIDHPLNQ